MNFYGFGPLNLDVLIFGFDALISEMEIRSSSVHLSSVNQEIGMMEIGFEIIWLF